MKKVLFLMISVLALGLVFAGCNGDIANITSPGTTETEGVVSLSRSNGNGEVLENTLYAGQNIDVGTVKVWNDAEYLYVEFKTDGNWCISESHVHVGESVEEDFPLTPGGPAPGQFDYKEEHDCITEYTYEIPLEWDACEEIYIAAHAVVWDKTSQECMDVFSDGTEAFSAYGGLTCDDTSVRTGTAVAAWQHSVWQTYVNPHYDNGTWIWESERVKHPVCGDVVDFEKVFTIPGYPISGEIKVTVDNAYEVFVNRDSVGSLGLIGDWRSSELKEENVVSGYVKDVTTYDILSELASGENVLRFECANEYSNEDDYEDGTEPETEGTVDDNPGGLIYEAEICYYEDEETAWGDGERFVSIGNWATYMTYTVQCPYEPGLVNGGFENTIVDTTDYPWDYYQSGEQDLGWTVEWYEGSTSYGGQTRPEPAYLEIHTSGTITGVDAYEGDQYAELDTDWDGPGGGLNAEPASVRIFQDIATCPGVEYTLTYAWRGRPGEPSEMAVKIDNVEDVTHICDASTTDWNEESIDFIATSWTTTLEFIETGTPDALGMFLDAVSVIKVGCPEE